jgi:hypothetical protein
MLDADDLGNIAYDRLRDKRLEHKTREEIRQEEKARGAMMHRLYKFQAKEKMKMTEQNFAKGVNVKVIKTQYGEILKLGVNVNQLGENPINDDGWVNLAIMTSKAGKKYVVVDDFKPKKKETDGEIMQFDDSEQIPF